MVGEPGAFTELDFATEDREYPAAQLSAVLGCRVELLEFLRTDADGLVLFVRLQDDSADELADRIAASPPDGVDVLQTGDGEVLAEYAPSASVVGTLADLGAIPQSATATDGTVRVTAVVPGSRDSRRVVEHVQAEHPTVTFTGKRERAVVAPLVTAAGVRSLFESLLTDRQWEAVRLAYERGYFDQPQGVSQTALAGTMGISQKTFSQHLNVAQRKLLSVVLPE